MLEPWLAQMEKRKRIVHAVMPEFLGKREQCVQNPEENPGSPARNVLINMHGSMGIRCVHTPGLHSTDRCSCAHSFSVFVEALEGSAVSCTTGLALLPALVFLKIAVAGGFHTPTLIRVPAAAEAGTSPLFVVHIVGVACGLESWRSLDYQQGLAPRASADLRRCHRRPGWRAWHQTWRGQRPRDGRALHSRHAQTAKQGLIGPTLLSLHRGAFEGHRRCLEGEQL